MCGCHSVCEQASFSRSATGSVKILFASNSKDPGMIRHLVLYRPRQEETGTKHAEFLQNGSNAMQFIVDAVINHFSMITAGVVSRQDEITREKHALDVKRDR